MRWDMLSSFGKFARTNKTQLCAEEEGEEKEEDGAEDLLISRSSKIHHIYGRKKYPFGWSQHDHHTLEFLQDSLGHDSLANKWGPSLPVIITCPFTYSRHIFSYDTHGCICSYSTLAVEFFSSALYTLFTLISRH